MTQTTHRLLPVVLAAVLAPAAHAYDSTTWTGAAGNGLWSDPLNWSDGLPTPTGYADLSRAGTTVDLGAATRQLDSLDLGHPDTRLTNGTLVLNRIDYNGFSSYPYPVAAIAAALTTTSPALSINSVNANRPLRIEGPIVGDNFELRAADTALAAANTYTGRTVVGHLFGNTTFVDQGSARNTAAFDVGSTLLVDNSSVNAPDRLNDAAPIRFVGGHLELRGNPDAPASERVGPLQLDAGGAEITLNPVRRSGDTTPYQPVTLRAASIERTSVTSGILRVVTDPAAGQKLLLDAAPPMVGDLTGATPTARPVVPWVLAQHPSTGASGLATYDPDAGLRPLDPATEFSPALPAPDAPTAPNVRLTTPQSTSRNVTVNSFTGELALDNADLTVQSGALLNATITGTGAVRAPGEMIVYGGTLAVPVHARSLTLAYSTTLDAPVHAPEGIHLTAADYRQRADLRLKPNADLGTAPLRFTSAGIVTFETPRALANDITIDFPGYALTGGRWIISSLDPALRLNIPTGQMVTLSGNLTGHTAALDVRGGTLRLDGTATFHSLYIGGPAAHRLELNGLLRPEDDRPDDPRYAFVRQSIRVNGHLGGDGTLLGVFEGGLVTPGRAAAPGRLTVDTIGHLDLTVDLDGPTPATDYDQLVVLTNLSNNLGRLTVDLAYTPPLGESFTILDNRSTTLIDDTFSQLPEGATLLANNTFLQISYTAGDGNDIALTVVPEPATPLLAIAALTLFPRRQRKVPG